MAIRPVSPTSPRPGIPSTNSVDSTDSSSSDRSSSPTHDPRDLKPHLTTPERIAESGYHWGYFLRGTSGAASVW